MDWKGATSLSFFISKKLFGAPPDTGGLPISFKSVSYYPTWPLYVFNTLFILSSIRRPVVDLKTLLVPSGFLIFTLLPRTRFISYLLSGIMPTMEVMSYYPGPGFPNAVIVLYSTCYYYCLEANLFSVEPNAPIFECQFLSAWTPSLFLFPF